MCIRDSIEVVDGASRVGVVDLSASCDVQGRGGQRLDIRIIEDVGDGVVSRVSVLNRRPDDPSGVKRNAHLFDGDVAVNLSDVEHIGAVNKVEVEVIAAAGHSCIFLNIGDHNFCSILVLLEGVQAGVLELEVSNQIIGSRIQSINTCLRNGCAAGRTGDVYKRQVVVFFLCLPWAS